MRTDLYKIAELFAGTDYHSLPPRDREIVEMLAKHGFVGYFTSGTNVTTIKVTPNCKVS